MSGLQHGNAQHLIPLTPACYRGVAVLQHMPALEEVDLSDTTVSNAALEELPHFNRHLRCINLSFSGKYPYSKHVGVLAACTLI